MENTKVTTQSIGYILLMKNKMEMLIVTTKLQYNPSKFYVIVKNCTKLPDFYHQNQYITLHNKFVMRSSSSRLKSEKPCKRGTPKLFMVTYN